MGHNNNKLNHEIINYKDYGATDGNGKPALMLISPMLHQGGFERVCIYTAKLMEKYYDVTVVIFSDRDIAYDISGLKIVNLDIPAEHGKLRKLLNLLIRSTRLKKLKKQLEIRASYSFGPSANLANCLSRWKETVIVGLRNYTDIEEVHKIRFFRHNADAAVCCSKLLENELKQGFSYDRTYTLYNLYDIERITSDSLKGTPELPFAPGTRILASMGREADQKAFWFMLKSFSLVHAAKPDTGLMIIGAGRYDEYKQLAEELGVADSVLFTGVQMKPYEYLKQACLYLLTSQNEGFPNALVEAMALGIPSVAVNCKTGPAEILTENADYSANKTVYGEYGILFPEIDPVKNMEPSVITEQEREYADTVMRLLDDSVMMTRYSAAAKKRAADFSYDAYSDRLHYILENIMNNGVLEG